METPNAVDFHHMSSDMFMYILLDVKRPLKSIFLAENRGTGPLILYLLIYIDFNYIFLTKRVILASNIDLP